MRLALILVFTAGWAAADPTLRLVSNVVWDVPEDWFGGFSGAEVHADGSRIVLITDRAFLVKARIAREGRAIRTLQLIDVRKLTHADGPELRDAYGDAEGLAMSRDGQAFVSFERQHRVMRLDLESGRTTEVGPRGAFADLQENSGLEALAIDNDGGLYTLPERSGAVARPFPLHVFRDGQWKVAAQIPRRGPFLPVGADFDDLGRFYLLERAATPLGFRSRVRRFDFDQPELGEVRLWRTGPGRYDNLEAISLWRSTEGFLRATMISDDNFLSIQRTQILEFDVLD